MAKAAWGNSAIDVRPAICVLHSPNNEQNQEMFFCFDCNRAFCSFCQLADDSLTNHKPHRTIKINELTRVRKQRIAQIREQLKQYSVKHDSTINAMNANVSEKKTQIQTLHNLIDQFAQRLHREIEDLKVRAKDLMKNKASLIWEKSPITSIQQVAEATLANKSEVRASLEYEIRRCEMDELLLAQGSKEMDSLSNQLEAFLQSQIELPAASAFDLTTLRTQLQASIAQLERQVSHSKNAFVRQLESRVLLPKPDSLRLVEQQAVPAQKLLLPSDQKKTMSTNGVAQEEDSDIIYLTDLNNSSKIKSLDLKSHRIAEVNYE